jgi:AAA+ superfamily predicted ATPase
LSPDAVAFRTRRRLNDTTANSRTSSSSSSSSRSRSRSRRRRHTESAAEEEDACYEEIRKVMSAIFNPQQQEQQVPAKAVKKKRRCPAFPKNAQLPPPPFKPKTLADLIVLGERASKRQMWRDCQVLPSLVAPLKELADIVGMDQVKTQITSMVVKEIQREHLKTSTLNHIKIEGPPGTGKTTLSKILARIMVRTGRLDTDTVVQAGRNNLVAEHLGGTAARTEATIRSAFGGVLLIDEITSMSDGRSTQNSDSYAKEALDTLNQMLEAHSDHFVCIIAGYADEIERDFFAVNQGLRSRFTTTFTLTGYTPEELREIFLFKLRAQGYTLASADLLSVDMFDDAVLFKSHGRSVQVLLDKVLEAHSLSCFGELVKDVITHDAVCAGWDSHRQECLKNNGQGDPAQEDRVPLHMYS